MDQVSKMKAAGAHNFFDYDDLRVDQCPAGNDDQGHEEIKDRKIGDFLQGVEFPAAVDRIRGFFAAEYAKQVIPCLRRDLFFQPAPSHPVVKPIMGEHITE